MRMLILSLIFTSAISHGRHWGIGTLNCSSGTVEGHACEVTVNSLGLILRDEKHSVVTFDLEAESYVASENNRFNLIEEAELKIKEGDERAAEKVLSELYQEVPRYEWDDWDLEAKMGPDLRQLFLKFKKTLKNKKVPRQDFLPKVLQAVSQRQGIQSWAVAFVEGGKVVVSYGHSPFFQLKESVSFSASELQLRGRGVYESALADSLRQENSRSVLLRRGKSPLEKNTQEKPWYTNPTIWVAAVSVAIVSGFATTYWFEPNSLSTRRAR